MKNAVIYFGSLVSPFARDQDWSKYALAIVACDKLEELRSFRSRGLKVFSYTHRHDKDQNHKMCTLDNDGLMLDWSTAPESRLGTLAESLRGRGKSLIVNTGWGSHDKMDYGPADMLIVESFIGSHSGDDGKWPVTYVRRDETSDMLRVEMLARLGYSVIALSYGPSEDAAFAFRCMKQAQAAYADLFIYCQAPGWEKGGSGFRFYP